MGTLMQESYLTFTLGNERFSTAARYVCEVMRPVRYTHLPGARAGILGVINVRGKILPVVDAALPLLGTPTKDPSAGLLLILNSAHGDVGLLVDDVHGLVEHATNGVAPPPDILHHSESVIGTIEHDGTFLTVVDVLTLVDGSISNRTSAPVHTAS